MIIKAECSVFIYAGCKMYLDQNQHRGGRAYLAYSSKIQALISESHVKNTVSHITDKNKEIKYLLVC